MAWWRIYMRLHFLYNIYYVNLDLRPHFLIDRYEIFMSIRRTISFPRTIYMYDLFMYFSISFFSALYPILSITVSTLNSIFPLSVSMFYSSYSLFKLTVTTFPILRLTGDICRFPMIVHKMVQPIEGQTSFQAGLAYIHVISINSNWLKSNLISPYIKYEKVPLDRSSNAT